MATHTQFRGFDDYGDAGLSDTLEQNLYAFFNWAFLGLGNWSTVERAASGWYGGDQSRLRLSEDPNYSAGHIWEGFRRDWVWETGVERAEQPVRVSGVWVDSSFYSIATTGDYAHVVDYPNGRVIFDNAISPSSVVQVSYSYRHVHVTTADDYWWREIQSYSLRSDDEQFLQYGSGVWSTMSQSRIQLPAIVIEASPELSIRPLMIGTTSAAVGQVVNLYILAETPYDKKRIHDILTRQYDKRISCFDIDAVVAATGYPLDSAGSPIISGLMYPDLVAPKAYGGYGEQQARVVNVKSYPMQISPGLYGSLVRWTCEVDLH